MKQYFMDNSNYQLDQFKQNYNGIISLTLVSSYKLTYQSGD